MIDDLLLGLGLVAIIEGLVFALASSRLRDIVEMMESMDVERRRLLGLLSVAIGIALVWFARG